MKRDAYGAFDLPELELRPLPARPVLRAYQRARRRKSALTAYVTFFLGWFVLATWGWDIYSSTPAPLSLTSALYALPLCVCLFLKAFECALTNFQIRVDRPATWREYLSTDQGFWPR